MILDAYHRGLLSKDECTKILGIDPNFLIKNAVSNGEHVYDFEQYTK